MVRAHELLEIRARRKRHGVRGRIPVRLRGGLDRRVGQLAGGVVESHGEEDGGHIVVVAEVGVQGAAQGEGRRVLVQRAVGGGVVLHGLVGHAGDELVGEADALRGAERVAGAVAVEFVQGFVVPVLLPLGWGEEVAEGRDGAGGRGDGVERTQVHHVDRVGGGEVGAGQVRVQSGLDGWDEDGGPLGLGGGSDLRVRAVFEICAEAVVKCVVRPGCLTDDGDRVRIGGIGNEFGCLFLMEALGPILSALYNSRFTRRANEWRKDVRQVGVAIEELDARVDHFLLAERRQLVGTECILVAGKKRVVASVSLHVVVNPLNSRVVRRCFACRRISSSMSRQDLHKRHLALNRNVGRDLRRHAEKRRVLAPAVRYVGLTLVALLNRIAARITRDRNRATAMSNAIPARRKGSNLPADGRQAEKSKHCRGHFRLLSILKPVY